MSKDGFTHKQRKAIDLLANGTCSIEEVAEECGVTVRTLYNWRRKAAFMDAVIIKARKHLKSRLPKLYKKMSEEAEDGDFKYFKLMLEHIEKLEEMNQKNQEAVIHFTWAPQTITKEVDDD